MQPTSVIINQDSFRAFDNKGLKHPVEPIKQLVPLSLKNVERAHKLIKLSDFLDFDLLIKFAVAPDFDWSDDRTGLNVYFQEVGTRRINNPRIRLSDTFEENNFILHHKKEYVFTCNNSLDEIILYCQPIYLLERIEINVSTLVTAPTVAPVLVN